MYFKKNGRRVFIPSLYMYVYVYTVAVLYYLVCIRTLVENPGLCIYGKKRELPLGLLDLYKNCSDTQNNFIKRKKKELR